MTRYNFCTVILLSILTLQVQAQVQRPQPRTGIQQENQEDRIRYEADYLEKGRLGGDEFNILYGNVILRQGQTVIYTDSAHFYDTRNYMEGFGGVRIIDGDSVTIISKKGSYDGETKLAQLREDVVYMSDSITLYTDFLDYNLEDKTAYYFNHGRIVDGYNELESGVGYYRTIPKIMSFKDSVILINERYTMVTDTMVYYTLSKVALTFGETHITTTDSTTVVSEGGKFITNRQITQFYKGTIETPSYIITGDELFLDDQSQFYSATKNASLTAKKDNVIISGDTARYWKAEGKTKVFGNPVMRKFMDPDTLYMSADVIISHEDSLTENDYVLAFPDVRIFHKQLQGKADSLAYYRSDSIIYLYRDPVLWNEGSQIEADSIDMFITSSGIDRMDMAINSFVITKDTLLAFEKGEGMTMQFFYNQIKGRDMIAYFKENKLDQVDVFSNGESLYFASEGDSLLAALNKIVCSDMKILLDGNLVSDIYFYTNPTGKLIPPHELGEENLFLLNFTWRIDERPSKEQVLNRNLPLSTPNEKDPSSDMGSPAGVPESDRPSSLQKIPKP